MYSIYSLIAYMRNSANGKSTSSSVNAAQVIEDKYENIDKELQKYVDYNQKKTRAFPPQKKYLFTPNPSTRLPARPHSQQRRCYHRSSQRDVARGREGRLGAC